MFSPDMAGNHPLIGSVGHPCGHTRVEPIYDWRQIVLFGDHHLNAVDRGGMPYRYHLVLAVHPQPTPPQGAFIGDLAVQTPENPSLPIGRVACGLFRGKEAPPPCTVKGLSITSSPIDAYPPAFEIDNDHQDFHEKRV